MGQWTTGMILQVPQEFVKAESATFGKFWFTPPQKNFGAGAIQIRYLVKPSISWIPQENSGKMNPETQIADRSSTNMIEHGNVRCFMLKEIWYRVARRSLWKIWRKVWLDEIRKRCTGMAGITHFGGMKQFKSMVDGFSLNSALFGLVI